MMTMARKADGDATISVSRPMLKFIGAHLTSLLIGSGVVGGVSYKATTQLQESFENRMNRLNDASEKRFEALSERIDRMMELLTRERRMANNK